MVGSPSKLSRDGVHTAMNALLSRQVLRMMSVHPCSASSVVSNTLTPFASRRPIVSATWSAPTTIRCVKLWVVTACCPGAGMMNMFGKPCVVMPWRLSTPSFHFSSIVMPPRPTIVCPARRGNGVSSASKPVASTMQSTSYSSPLATTPCGVMRVTPSGQSTNVTFGLLKATRYSSWKHGRLQP